MELIERQALPKDTYRSSSFFFERWNMHPLFPSVPNPGPGLRNQMYDPSDVYDFQMALSIS